MRPPRTVRLILGALLICSAAVVVAACVGAQATRAPAQSEPPATASPAAPPASSLQLLAAGPPRRPAPAQLQVGANWPFANGDLRNTRAVTSAISSETVGELAPAWTFAIPGLSTYGSAAGAPVIAGGVVYFQNLTSDVFAFDLESGEELWRHEYFAPVAGPNGPVVDGGRVFAAHRPAPVRCARRRYRRGAVERRATHRRVPARCL